MELGPSSEQLSAGTSESDVRRPDRAIRRGDCMTAIEDATIWKVVVPSTKRSRPGKVLAARLTRVQAVEMAALLRNDGVECEVGRA